MPTAVYGVVLLLAAVAFFILLRTPIAERGTDSTPPRAIGRNIKGKISPVIYAVAILLALINRWIAFGLYVAVALLWLIPDRRIARATSEVS